VDSLVGDEHDADERDGRQGGQGGDLGGRQDERQAGGCGDESVAVEGVDVAQAEGDVGQEVDRWR